MWLLVATSTKGVCAASPLEQAELVWQWLQEGAYFYVCGDASRMAKDVHQALITVVEQQGGLNREQAEEYVSELRKAKRYQRDVY